MANRCGAEGSSQASNISYSQQSIVNTGGGAFNPQPPRWGMNGDLNQSTSSSTSYQSRGWGWGNDAN
jgi:hypothetical protein